MSYYGPQIVLSLISAIGFGIIFNVPRKALIHCGIIGMGGWMFYFLMTERGVDITTSAFCGAFIVGVLGHGLAKYFKIPIIVYIVPGIIPLVPGGTAYDAMRHMVSNDFSNAIPLTTKVFIIASSIALGLVFAEVFVLLLQRKYKPPS